MIEPIDINIRYASKAEDHKRLVTLAKTSPYTKDFSNEVMFSPDAAYAKGWIRLAEDSNGELLGFYCVRHKVREPVTSLYFIVVDPAWRSGGVGVRLMNDLYTEAYSNNSRAIRLNVVKDNRAVAFYKRLGYRIVSEDALKGTAYTMEIRL